MNGSGPVRADLELPAHREDEEANQPREGPGMRARAERSRDWACPKFPLARCKLSRNTFRQITTLFPKKSARPNVECQVRHFGGVVVFGVVFGSCVQEAAEFWVWRVFECNFRGKSTVLSGRRRHHKPRAQRAAE